MVTDITHDDDKLVAAESAHRIFAAHGLGQATRHDAQQTVADMMAQRVIDEFEAVQIDEQHSHLLAGRTRLPQRLAQTLLAQRAVGQLGQHIVVGQKVDALFVRFTVGNVNRRGNEIDNLATAGALEHRGNHQPRRVAVALGTAHHDFTGPQVFIGAFNPVQGLRAVDQGRKIGAYDFMETVGRAATK